MQGIPMLKLLQYLGFYLSFEGEVIETLNCTTPVEPFLSFCAFRSYRIGTHLYATVDNYFNATDSFKR